MPFEYSFDPDENLIRVKCTGPFSIGDLIDHSRRVTEDPAFVSGMNTLGDYRDADWQGIPSDIAKYVDHTALVAELRGPCRWACLVSKDDDANLIRTFDLVVRERGIPIRTRAFLEEPDAMGWLSGPNGDQ